jgi:hypothetical protein
MVSRAVCLVLRGDAGVTVLRGRYKAAHRASHGATRLRPFGAGEQDMPCLLSTDDG